MKSTITITFSESVENHKGMQIIGKKADKGYSDHDIREYYYKFKNLGYNVEYYDLNQSLKQTTGEKASLLVVRNFLNDANDLFSELSKLNWDSKAFMYGRVVNKKARHNLCFADFDQEADFENKRGTIINFNKLKYLSDVRNNLQNILDDKLYAEGNLYYDINKCYIGYHGDTERSKVVALRLGENFPLFFRWYQNTEPISQPMKFNIHSGDVYIMSDLATGNNWKKKSIPTLRHAAGFEKNL
jgi:hypothetical protein